MESPSRDRIQNAARVGGLVFVLLWLFWDRLQVSVPFWVPFLVLAATELELLVRGLAERRRGAPPLSRERRLPGAADADLGWVETVDDEGEAIFVPAPPRPRRNVRWPLVATVLAGIVLFTYAYRVDRDAGWSGVSAAQRRQAEALFTREAARIAKRSVVVRCDDEYAFTGVGSDAAGVAFIPRRLAYLEPDVCLALYEIAFKNRVGPRDAAAFAISVLAHEATHLRGVTNEAETECYALQEGVKLGVRLGLDAKAARSLMRAQRDRDLSDESIQRLDYRLPPGCRDGGSLDLRPADSSFP